MMNETNQSNRRVVYVDRMEAVLDRLDAELELEH